jgi:hypothetical protein
MTFGGGNLRGYNIPVAWQNHQNRSQQRIAVTVFYERWTRPTVFRLRTPPPNVISQAGLTLRFINYDIQGVFLKCAEILATRL